MGKDPVIPLYASDCDMDTASWTAAQFGVYMRLLIYAWVNGGIPQSMAEMARIARIDVRSMAKMWSAVVAKKFVPHDANMYVNPRMEIEREKKRKYHESQVEKGKRGAEKRYQKDVAGAIAEPLAETQLSFSSSISNNIKAEEASGLPFFENNNGNEKAREEIAKLAVLLNGDGFQALKWIGKAIKDRKHPEAILRALQKCMYEKPRNPWAYCQKIINIESGNYYEQESIKRNEELKKQ